MAAPTEIQALLNLLADPKVQAWIEKQSKAEPPAVAAKPKLASPTEMMSTRVDAVREHIAEMAVAVQDMPAQFAYAGDTLERTIGNPPIAANLDAGRRFCRARLRRRGAVLVGNTTDTPPS